MIEQWLSDPSKIGATILLMSAIVAFYKGYVVPRWTFDATLALKDEAIKSGVSDCKFQREMNERLLGKLERSVTVAEVSAETAAKAITGK